MEGRQEGGSCLLSFIYKYTGIRTSGERGGKREWGIGMGIARSV